MEQMTQVFCYIQCCGSGMFFPIPDPTFFPSRIRIFSIPDPDPDYLHIPDPGVKKAPDPGTGSATLVILMCKNSISGSLLPRLANPGTRSWCAGTAGGWRWPLCWPPSPTQSSPQRHPGTGKFTLFCTGQVHLQNATRLSNQILLLLTETWAGTVPT